MHRFRHHGQTSLSMPPGNPLRYLYADLSVQHDINSTKLPGRIPPHAFTALHTKSATSFKGPTEMRWHFARLTSVDSSRKSRTAFP